MNKTMTTLSALCLAAASMTAAAQDESPASTGQYFNLSLFSWEAQNQRQTIDAEFDGVDTVTGTITETRSRAEAQGLRLLAGHQLTSWLGIELHVATGGSRRSGMDRTATDFEVVFPDDFDFTQIDSVDDVNLDDFELDLTTTEDSLPAKVDLNQVWSLMLRPAWTPNQLFSLYGLVGYSYAKVDYQTEPSWYTVSERGLSYGVGADIAIFPEATAGKLRAHVDYVRYLDESAIELDALSFGLGLRF